MSASSISITKLKLQIDGFFDFDYEVEALDMFSALDAAIRYINASRAINPDPTFVESVVQQQIGLFTNQLGNLDTSDSLDNERTLVTLRDSPFSPAQRMQIMNAINARIQDCAASMDAGGGGSGNSKSQTCIHIEKYVYQKIDDVLIDTDNKDENTRLNIFVDDFMIKCLGIKFADVPTRKRCAGLFMLYAGYDQHSSKATKIAKKIYDDMYKIIVEKRKHRGHIPIRMKVYPEDPDRFLSLHPGTYPHGQAPIIPRFSDEDITDYAALVSARGHNKLLKDRDQAGSSDNGQLLPVNKSTSNINGTNMMDMMNMMAMYDMCRQRQRAQSHSKRSRCDDDDSENDIHIDIFENGRRPPKKHITSGASDPLRRATTMHSELDHHEETPCGKGATEKGTGEGKSDTAKGATVPQSGDEDSSDDTVDKMMLGSKDKKPKTKKKKKGKKGAKKEAAAPAKGDCKLKFPGTKPKDVVIWKDWSIKTDVASSCWRVKHKDWEKEKCACWPSDPHKAWNRVLDIINDN